MKFLAILFIFGIGLASSIPLNRIENLFANRHEKHEQNKYKLSSSLGGITPKEECDLCYALLPIAKDLIKKNDTKLFKEISTLVCLTLKITSDEQVCEQAIGLFEVSL